MTAAYLRTNLIHLMNNRSKLSGCDFAGLLNEILDRRDFGWELGPDLIDSDTDILSFSIFGLLSELEEMSGDLELPIFGDGWRIQAGIPPRGWEKAFEYTGMNGNFYCIEGMNWKWSSVMKERLLHVTFYPDIKIEIGDRDEICRILIIGEIGETNLKKYIGSISCSDQKVIGIQEMALFRSHFSQSFPDCLYRDYFLNH